MKKKTVCIVGAGPAGLVGAKVLRTNQFDVTIFEKASRIGGIWAVSEASTGGGGYLHPDTPTNLSRFTVAFSDLDWNAVDLTSKLTESLPDGMHDGTSRPLPPPPPPMFPKAWQVNRYLEAYRERNIPLETLKLGHQVVRTERVSDSDGNPTWVVTTRNGDAKETEYRFDHLLLSSGFFSHPRPIAETVPLVPTNPEVIVIHSAKFRSLDDLFPNPSKAVGKTILVIGSGNSAGETAGTVAQQLSNAWYSVAGEHEPRLYTDCDIVQITPRPLYGVPPYTSTHPQYKTFKPIDFQLYDLSRRPAGPITGTAGRVPQVVNEKIHEALQKQIGGDQSDLGQAGLTIPPQEPRSPAYLVLTETYSEFARSGVIKVMPGRVTEIANRKEGECSAMVTGPQGSVQLDNIGAIIYATGYSPATGVKFLPEAVKQALHYDPGSVRLPLILQGWQTMTPEVPDLAFLGFYEGPYWPVMEMQARVTATRWLSDIPIDPTPYEDREKLLELRQLMQNGSLDVPSYWFRDYTGYMEEIAAYLKLERNDGAFEEREGPVSPARYLSSDSGRAQADAIMKDLHQVWHACTYEAKYVARAAFRALQGNWAIQRTIKSALPSFPSGVLEGEARFHPRLPTLDQSGKRFDQEFLYIESGTLNLSTGASLSAQRRYVYRYSEERDELSVWFVKADNDMEVDYLFHNLAFLPQEENKDGVSCVARAEHLCVDDMYWTEYRLPIKGIALHAFETEHTVRGPSKDYVATTKYTRPMERS